MKIIIKLLMNRMKNIMKKNIRRVYKTNSMGDY